LEKGLLIVLAVVGVILLFLLVIPQEGSRVEAPSVERLVESGHFLLEEGEALVAQEEYTLLYSESEGYMLLSQGTLTTQSASISLAQQFQFDRNFMPILYNRGAETPSGSQLVSAQMGVTGMHVEVRVGLGRRVADVPAGRNTILLDSHLVSHYVVLWRGASQGAIGRDFTILVPQELLVLPGHLEEPVPTEFLSAGTSYAGELVGVMVGERRANLLIYGRRVAGLFLPAQGGHAYNTDLFPGGISLVEPGGSTDDLRGAVSEHEVSSRSAELLLTRISGRDARRGL
jgi:hypothetical protein